jgi:hypothetical protein
MRNTVKDWTILVCGVVIAPAIVGAVTMSLVVFLTGLLSATVASFVVFVIFARAESARMNAEMEQMEAAWLDEEPMENRVNLREQVISDLIGERVDKLWLAELEKLRGQDISEESLPSAYRKAILKLYDEMDMHYAEEVAGFSFSKILWLMARSPYTFRKFCKTLGK